MTARELLDALARQGVTVEAHGDRLRYSPREAVTPDLLERLREHKAELLALLRPPGRRLIGCGFPPRPRTTPPPAILATARLVCPVCGVQPVLPELRGMTAGRCWDCYWGEQCR